MASSVDHTDHPEAAHLAGEAGRLLARLRTGIGETMTADEARNRGDARSHTSSLPERSPGYTPRTVSFQRRGRTT